MPAGCKLSSDSSSWRTATAESSPIDTVDARDSEKVGGEVGGQRVCDVEGVEPWRTVAE